MRTKLSIILSVLILSSPLVSLAYSVLINCVAHDILWTLSDLGIIISLLYIPLIALLSLGLLKTPNLRKYLFNSLIFILVLAVISLISSVFAFYNKWNQSLINDSLFLFYPLDTIIINALLIILVLISFFKIKLPKTIKIKTNLFKTILLTSLALYALNYLGAFILEILIGSPVDLITPIYICFLIPFICFTFWVLHSYLHKKIFFYAQLTLIFLAFLDIIYYFILMSFDKYAVVNQGHFFFILDFITSNVISFTSFLTICLLAPTISLLTNLKR
jgi:hypothetical protein